MPNHNERMTRKLELVETDNIARSLNRLRSSAGGYNDERWRRALQHAIAMSVHRNAAEKIRVALELP